MIALLLPLAFAAAAVSPSVSALEHCIERSDRACVSALLTKSATETSPQYWATAARGELLLGNRPEAVAAINRAVKQKPGDFDLLLEQGWVYQKSGDQVNAIRSFLSAGQIQPRSPAVFYELGMSFFLLHEFDRAVTHFQRVLELDPKHDKAEFMLGILDVLKNADAAAKVHFEGALSMQPANAHYLLHYGVLLLQLNDPDDALVNMRKAEEIDPSNPLTHFNLGRLYRQMGKLSDAERELRTAIRMRPAMARAYYQLSTVYRLQGRTADAAKALEQFSRFKEQDKDDDPIDANLTQ
jgi:tetratricopeptide (TPR) repeat protein